MPLEFITSDNTMEDLVTNWKITSPIAYIDTDFPSVMLFSVNVETIIPKTHTIEQSIATVGLNCKAKTQEQYDLYVKSQAGDWLSNMDLKSYLNMVVKTGV